MSNRAPTVAHEQTAPSHSIQVTANGDFGDPEKAAELIHPDTAIAGKKLPDANPPFGS
jgi:hypothetical protein